MRQLTLYVLLSFGVCLAVATAQSVGAGPVPLLPGYTHRSDGFGIDSGGGEIWKANGPSISYDVGPFVGDLTASYAQRFPKSATIQLKTPPGHPFVVVVDEEHDAMSVSIYRASFHAQNVKSRVDVAEVLAIVKMFELHAESGR
jgi:hypothetical protein